MARPKGPVITETFKAAEPVYQDTRPLAPKTEKPKGTVRFAHLIEGLDLIGSKTTVSNRNGTQIFEQENGLRMVNKEGRTVVIPFGNLRGYELL